MKSTNFARSFALGSLFTLGLLGPALPSFGQTNYVKNYPLTSSERSGAYDLARSSGSAASQKLVMPGTIETTNAHPSSTLIDFYHDARMLFTNLSGTAVRDWRLESAYDDRAFATTKIDLSNMLVVGHTRQGYTMEDRLAQSLPDTTADGDIFLTVFNNPANLLIHKTYDFGDTDEHAYSAVTQTNSSIFILGRKYNSATQQNGIIFLNSNRTGDLLSANLILDDLGANLQPRKLVRINGNEFLILASSDRAGGRNIHSQDPNFVGVRGSDIVVIRVDLTGTILSAFSVQTPNGGNPNVRPMDMTVEGDFAYAVGASDAGGWMLKIDNFGTPISMVLLNFPAEFSHPYVVEPNAGNLWISGKTDANVVFKASVNPSLAVVQSWVYDGNQTNWAGENGILTNQYIAGWDGTDLQLMAWPRNDTVCNSKLSDLVEEEIDLNVESLAVSLSPLNWELVSNSSIYELTPSTETECEEIPASKTQSGNATTASLFPNPAQSEIQVFIQGEEPSLVKIMDVQGRVMLEKGLDAGYQKLSVADLENGIYFLQISNSTYSNTHRLIIQR